MTTKPQPTFKASINKTLREPVWRMNTYQRMWGEGRKINQANYYCKAHGNDPVNFPGTSPHNSSETTALASFNLNSI